MTTDTDALLATVRDALNPYHAMRLDADAALDSLAAELERSKRIAKAHWDANTELVDQYEAKLTAHVGSLSAAEDELERLREKPDQPTLNAARRLLNATDNAERNAALGDLYNELEVEAMAELERVKAARQRESVEADVAVRALNATLERVKAERDDERAAAIRLDGQLARALSALREAYPVSDNPARQIIRAAIAEIEG